MKSIVTLVIKKTLWQKILQKQTSFRNDLILRTNLDFSSIRVRVPPPCHAAAAAPAVVMLAAFTTTASEANLSSCWLSHFAFVTITYVVAAFVGVAVFCLSYLDCNDAGMIPYFSKEF